MAAEPKIVHCHVGGTGNLKQADQEVQDILDKVKDHVKEKSEGRDYSNLKAVSYKTQVVAGTNYFVKAKANNGNHVHLRIFKPLPCYGDKPELHSLQHDKSADDEINYF